LDIAGLDSLSYFWWPTGRLAGTTGELAGNTVLAPGLSGFKPHRWVNPLKHNHKKR